MKEYGGYMPIELRDGSEYYSFDSGIMKRVNSGRTAILNAILDGGYTKVYLPLYMCNSVGQALSENNISYELYNIDTHFKPLNIEVGQSELLIWANYYGLMTADTISDLREQYKNILFDNTQAFFAEPILEAYNVYSCRKFFGVSDGAYVIHKGLKVSELDKSMSTPAAHYLLDALENGTNAEYEAYLKGEEKIETEGMKSMSDLTCKILKSIDYEAVKQKRRDNFSYLHSCLKERNELPIRFEDQVPMIYPLLVSDDGLRKYLIENKIYISQWWKWVLEVEAANEFEKKLSRYLLPIPIDQRYSIDDMKEIVDIIFQYTGWDEKL